MNSWTAVQIVAGLVLGLGARMPQIVLNFRRGHTGALNPATFAFNSCANTVNGTVAVLMTGDLYVIGTQIWMLVLNLIVLSQIVVSRRADAEAEAQERDKVRKLSYDDDAGPGRAIEYA